MAFNNRGLTHGLLASYSLFASARASARGLEGLTYNFLIGFFLGFEGGTADRRFLHMTAFTHFNRTLLPFRVNILSHIWLNFAFARVHQRIPVDGAP